MRTARSSSHLLGVCLSACWDTFPPGVGLVTPLGVGLETPQCGPGDPLGVGLETPGCGPGDPPGQIPQPPPWVWARRPARHAGTPPLDTCKACWDTTCNACWDTTPPPHPHGHNSWHTLLKILPCPKLHLQVVTRKHSSRMHTARLPTICGRSVPCWGGGCTHPSGIPYPCPPQIYPTPPIQVYPTPSPQVYTIPPGIPYPFPQV